MFSIFFWQLFIHLLYSPILLYLPSKFCRFPWLSTEPSPVLPSYHLPRYHMYFHSFIYHLHAIGCLLDVLLQSSKSISIEMSKSAHLPLCPIFIYDISLDPAAHARGSELTFSSSLFSRLIIYQILFITLDLSVLSTTLIPTGTTYWKLPSFLDKATYCKSFLTCFYMSTFAS